MKKQLLTVGDSFTYGDELADRYQAWPYLLADKLDHEVHNLGQSGCSNASILRRTLEELATNHYDLVIIGWTNPGRIEWKDDIGIEYNLWPGYHENGKFFEDHPWRLEFLKFLNQHHNSAYLYEQYLIQVISLQSYFQANDIDYRMLDVKCNNYYRKVGSEMYDKLETKINSEKFIGWKKFGMGELVADLPTGPRGHPLTLGHEKIANEIYTRNICRVS